MQGVATALGSNANLPPGPRALAAVLRVPQLYGLGAQQPLSIRAAPRRPGSVTSLCVLPAALP